MAQRKKLKWVRDLYYNDKEKAEARAKRLRSWGYVTKIKRFLKAGYWVHKARTF